MFSTDRCPPWFNRLQAELERANTSYLRTPNKFVRQRPSCFDQDRLQSENYARNCNHNTPHGKRLITEDQDSFLRRFVDKVFLQHPKHPHGRQDLKHAVHLAQRDGRSDRQNVHANGGRNNPPSFATGIFKRDRPLRSARHLRVFLTWS